jgi:hypothetical protein
MGACTRPKIQEQLLNTNAGKNANERGPSLHHFEPSDFDSKITNLMP